MQQNREAEIILIRHGETQWNIEGRWQGHADSPLTKKGVNQAKAVAKRLRETSFSALYSSDLGRAMQTATIISHVTGHEIVADQRLRERNVGVLQGMTLKEMMTRYPEEWSQYQSQKAEYVIPEGESANQRSQINIEFLTGIAKKHMGECAVIITHGGVLNNLFKHVLKIPPEGNRRYKIYNGAINSFAYSENGWILRIWGDISHYDQSGVLDEVQT